MGKGGGGKGGDYGGGMNVNQIVNLVQQLTKGNGKGKGKGKGLQGFKPDCKVWIGSIAEGTTWKELQEHMNQAGKTRWVEVFHWKGKGTGAVAYGSSEEASNAIATLNGSVLKGSPLECDVWAKQA